MADAQLTRAAGRAQILRAVLVGRDDLLQRACAEAGWLGLRAHDVLLGILPFSFDVGLNQLLASLVAGAELVVLESWLPADVLNVVAARGVTGIAAVPSIWIEFMKQQRALDRANAHRSLRFLTVSSGDLSAAQHAQLVALAGGAEIFKTYGQTETFRTSSLRPEEYAGRPLSVGRALPGVRLYIRRVDGTLADAGEVGEVVHTGTGSMLGSPRCARVPTCSTSPRAGSSCVGVGSQCGDDAARDEPQHRTRVRSALIASSL